MTEETTKGTMHFWRSVKSACEGAPMVMTGGVLAATVIGFFAYRHWDRISPALGTTWNNVTDSLLRRGGRLTWNSEEVSYQPTPTAGFYGPGAEGGHARVEGQADVVPTATGDSAFDHGRGNTTVIAPTGKVTIGGSSS